VYLLDEPTNHLDPAQQLGILEHLRALTRAGAAVVASLHEPNLALRFADRACLLFGDGSYEMVDCATLGPTHLTRLYGVPYAEGIVGGRRFMAADSSARSR
jgi:iron complex transport system ATP-binding protein